MNVTVKASSALEKYIKKSQISANHLSAVEAAILAGIPKEEIGLIIRNSKKIDFDDVLEDGDMLTIFPTIIGG